jgi:hypothetical protein
MTGGSYMIPSVIRSPYSVVVPRARITLSLPPVVEAEGGPSYLLVTAAVLGAVYLAKRRKR